MIETFMQALPPWHHPGCRSARARGWPVLMFLHGFPEGAYVWEALLEHLLAQDDCRRLWKFLKNTGSPNPDLRA